MFSAILTSLLALTSSVTARSVETRSLTPRSITPPEGCPIPTWKVDDFRWFNGSHSLDCIHSEVDKNAKGCLCGRDWCEPNPDTCNGTMVNVCYTGMPNYQPWGYGPPQTLAIDFEDGLHCGDTYIGYRVHDIAHGESNCGYADRGLGRIVSFYGSSNEEKSTGHMDYVLGGGHALECANGSKITYSGSTDFTLNCIHDEFFNATCTAEPFEVPVLSYSWVN
ncbi:hypothetical protein BDV27DRAFT_145567 [Aspergillus caelatus]|uniref:Uncharacterized protein n=2 Tax=Aspergillus subgen. Circumdati TaxID=2720871 RepID=A0A5N7A2J5_9EURO|nr:uncharacterized protein BDV27DRAFT_145567 [Aspergillus caelatus]KAE8364097.1 hypothetical protein BDV27DRAFT_145567 [Aspergillus caelatus]KAE8416427.1 hypothetical protein BDV36DRAFT_297122 [Aspergillus pseudocaelatus]